MITALFALSFLGAQTQTVTLSRGAPLPESCGAFRYWGAEDTFLSSIRPDENFGGAITLQGGTGKKVLIRFGDLERILGGLPTVSEATLVLRQFGQGALKAPVVSRALVPWGEGPGTKIGVSSTLQPNWGATWKERRSGKAAIGWQRPGASGNEDVLRLEGVTSTVDEANGVLTIQGLGPAVQDMARAWHRNHGLVLEFDGMVDFFSSDAAVQDRPKLLVTFAPGGKPKGPDLGVQFISRSPEFHRLQPEMQMQGGVGVPVALADPLAKRWPANGDEITYTATIRNTGDAPSSGFRYRWVRGERKLSSTEVNRTLGPGEQTLVELKVPAALDHSDHRIQPIGLLIEPISADASAHNDYLEVTEAGLAYGVVLDPGLEELAATQGVTAEEWIQRNTRFLNDVILPKSRFSGMLDGVQERIRLQSVRSLSVGQPFVPNPNLDAEVWLSKEMMSEPVSRHFHRLLVRALGVPDLGAMAHDATKGTVQLDFQNPLFRRGSQDPFPGLTGGGDTRNEAGIPNLIGIPYEPVLDRLIASAQLESTDLLAMTEAMALQTQMGQRAGMGETVLYDVPGYVTLRALDGGGRPLANASIGVWRLRDGKITKRDPDLVVTTDAQGQTDLPRAQLAEDVRLPNGRTITPNIFGPYAPDGADAAYLFAASLHGQTASRWLKVWHLVDVYHRGTRSAAIYDLQFDLPQGPIDRTANLAEAKLLKDSAGRDALALSSLTDGDLTKSLTFSGAIETWIDLDLGRDRQIGEVRILLAEPNLWPDFEIGVYQTGENDVDAFPFARETNAGWTFGNRFEALGDSRGLSYTGMPVRGRYIRITARKPFAGEVRITEIQVFGAGFGS